MVDIKRYEISIFRSGGLLVQTRLWMRVAKKVNAKSVKF